MGKLFADISDDLRAFISAQHMFFVATAPLSADGHVNLSPKGLDTFRVLGPTRVAYLDLTGSGVETIAHLRENGRLTVMFCAFAGRPRIVRIQGRGRVVLPTDAEWAEVSAGFPPLPGVRSIIVLDADRISDSCGYGVPLYEFAGRREQLTDWADTKGADGVADYQARKNRQSIDGLPGLG
jgi:hypothetical protein